MVFFSSHLLTQVAFPLVHMPLLSLFLSSPSLCPSTVCAPASSPARRPINRPTELEIRTRFHLAREREKTSCSHSGGRVHGSLVSAHWRPSEEGEAGIASVCSLARSLSVCERTSASSFQLSSVSQALYIIIHAPRTHTHTPRCACALAKRQGVSEIEDTWSSPLSRYSLLFIIFKFKCKCHVWMKSLEINIYHQWQ